MLNFKPVTACDKIRVYRSCLKDEDRNIADEFLPTGNGKKLLWELTAFVYSKMTDTTRGMGAGKKFAIRKVSIHPDNKQEVLAELEQGMDVTIESIANGVEDGYLFGYQPQGKNNGILLSISLTLAN